MHVIVVGCGRVGSQLATFLSEEGHDVAIIDKTEDSFRRLGSTFNGLTVEGLGFDQDILKEAGIEKCNVFAAVTDLDNTNMMAVEVATKLFYVPRAIARLYNPERAVTYDRLNIEYVCGTTMLAEKLVQAVTAPDVDVVSAAGNLYIVRVTASDKLAGRTVGEVDKEGGFRIITIIRRLRNIFCETDTKINRNDHLVIITKKDLIPQIERLARAEEATE